MQQTKNPMANESSNQRNNNDEPCKPTKKPYKATEEPYKAT
jgi:hypothetical protein